MLKESDILTRDKLEDWISKFAEALTPLDWAERALDYAKVKHSRRTLLRPYLARVIAEAQDAAVMREKRKVGEG